MATTHRYQARCSWTGSTGAGYDTYDRRHLAWAPPADATLYLASDPAFQGDPSRLNPEQLLVLAASSCQLLSFLAVAARARLDVVAYEDDASGEMPEVPGPMSLARIVLRPRITLAGPVDQARVRHLVEIAHRECYVANSLRTPVEVDATVVEVTAGPR